MTGNGIVLTHLECRRGRRSFVAGLFTAGATLALGGCGKRVSYRYKLTLSLNTPGGLKTGFNVVEVDYWTVAIPARGVAHRSRGQGIFIDLGSDRHPLIALLGHNRRAQETGQEIVWGENGPTTVIASKLFNIRSSRDWDETAFRFGTKSDPIHLSTSDLPDLVTFSDANDHKTLMLVDPDNLTATLGRGVSWQSMTIQIVDEPLTRGIDENLPWIRSYEKEWILDERIFFSLDNRVDSSSFIRER